MQTGPSKVSEGWMERYNSTGRSSISLWRSLGLPYLASINFPSVRGLEKRWCHLQPVSACEAEAQCVLIHMNYFSKGWDSD